MFDLKTIRILPLVRRDRNDVAMSEPHGFSGDGQPELRTTVFRARRQYGNFAGTSSQQFSS